MDMANELILAVDDEAHILELLTFNLEASGYRVVTAATGEDALVVCAHERPAMILLDDVNLHEAADPLRGLSILMHHPEWRLCLTLQDAGAGSPVPANLFDRGFTVRLARPSASAPWKPALKSPAPAVAMASLEAVREAALPLVEDNVAPVLAERMAALRKKLAEYGVTLSRRALDDTWNYCGLMTAMLKEDAVAVLEELGFVVKCTEIFSAGDAPNTVISQSVKADTDLERDSVIRLKISLGREDVDTSKFEEVGNFVGMEFEEAKLLLSELHLYAFQAEAVYDPEVPKGVVISQEIEEGMKVPQGTVINMVVSLGVETVRVPQVTLMNVNAAKSLLESMRLKAVMMYVANSSYATDSVISQATPAGKLVPVDSEIWLTVSTGTQNTIISTGGWSGAPLPTFETTETTTSETSVSETMTTQTDVTETTTTQESSTETADSTPPETTDSTKATETAATTKATETQQTVQTTAEPQPTDPPATDPPATAAPETQPATNAAQEDSE